MTDQNKTLHMRLNHDWYDIVSVWPEGGPVQHSVELHDERRLTWRERWQALTTGKLDQLPAKMDLARTYPRKRTN